MNELDLNIKNGLNALFLFYKIYESNNTELIEILKKIK